MSSPLPVEPQSKPKRARKSPFRPPEGRPPQHGARMLTRVLRTVRLDTIDQRSQVGVALRRLREEMLADIGGDPTAAQRVLIEEAAKARVIAQAVGDYILRQETLVRDGKLLDVVMQHSTMVGNLGRLLERLGLRRVEREADVAAELAALHSR